LGVVAIWVKEPHADIVGCTAVRMDPHCALRLALLPALVSSPLSSPLQLFDHAVRTGLMRRGNMIRTVQLSAAKYSN